MLNVLYKILLSLSATSWFILVFCAKYFYNPQTWLYWVGLIVIFILSLVITRGTIYLSNKLPTDPLNKYNELEIIDTEGMPVYLGFFFVALSVEQLIVAVMVYAMIFLFTILTHSFYFNPLYIIFGYHFYRGKTINGICHTLIIRGDIIKTASSLPDACYAHRINNTSFIINKESNNE